MADLRTGRSMGIYEFIGLYAVSLPRCLRLSLEAWSLDIFPQGSCLLWSSLCAPEGMSEGGGNPGEGHRHGHSRPRKGMTSGRAPCCLRLLI